MLRELSRDEVGFVSGGTDDEPDPIIVNGQRTQSSISLDDWLSIRQNATSDFSFGNFGCGVGGGTPSDWVDTDGDGVPDSPPIVVNAPLTVAQAREAWAHSMERAQWQWYMGQVTVTVGGLYFGGVFATAATIGDLIANAPPVNNAAVLAMARANFALMAQSGGVGNFYQNSLLIPNIP